MESLLKELAKLEKVAAYDGKGKSLSISDSLDGLLVHLQSLKDNGRPLDRLEILRNLEARKNELDERQKEVYSSMAKLGKALDKKFPTPLPSYPGLFSSEESSQALEKAAVLHLLRTGQFEAAESLLLESRVEVPDQLRVKFQDLYLILAALKRQDVAPALQWTQEHRAFLQSRSSPLEFCLHRFQYLRLLLSSDTPNVAQAIAYANASLLPFFRDHETEFQRLLTCIMYLPSGLQGSPYSDLTLANVHSELEPLFAKDYCASLGLSQHVPLKVVTSIGGGTALAKIEKGRRVISLSKGEWSQTDELPIEIPVPPENRYHSIFTCPVSKEQSTTDNPPMMLTCGHVIAQDSLHKISKPMGANGRVKCPYCPNESSSSSAIQMYF